MMDGNITLEQYIKVVEKAKQAALDDLGSFDISEVHNSEEPIFSVLGVKLCCRDDEDAFWVIGHTGRPLFLRFKPNMMKFIRSESNDLLEDDEPGQESARDKLYWEVTKYKQIGEQMCEMYEAWFSLDCELIGVRCSMNVDTSQSKLYRDFFWHPEKYIPLSDAERYLIDSKEQLFFAENVELPYHPGDVLYVDARPFGKPLYTVYGAATNGDSEYFEWTKEEYGYYKRRHYCLYISEDRNGLDITKLTCNDFTDYIPFPYSPLDRIKVVDSCDNPLLMKVSGLLKDNPDLFYTWIQNR